VDGGFHLLFTSLEVREFALVQDGSSPTVSCQVIFYTLGQQVHFLLILSQVVTLVFNLFHYGVTSVSNIFLALPRYYLINMLLLVKLTTELFESGSSRTNCPWFCNLCSHL